MTAALRVQEVIPSFGEFKDIHLMEYLIELRKRLLLCITVTLLFFGFLCFFANPLYQIIAQPLLMQMANGHLIATKITSTFLVPIKFVFILSIFLSIPYLLYHAWAFIAPALYAKEKKILWVLLLPSIGLFYLGTVFAYYVVLPIIFRFFVNTTPASVELRPDISQYLDFVLQLLLAFGLTFEVPVVVLVLAYFHVVTLSQLRAGRPYVIVIAFVLGMLLTPPDVISQTLLAIPLWLLYELGLLLAQLLFKFFPRQNN